MGHIACAMHAVVHKEEPLCRDDGRVRSPLSVPILLAKDRASAGRGLVGARAPRAWSLVGVASAVPPPGCPGFARWRRLRRLHGDRGERRPVLEAKRGGREGPGLERGSCTRFRRRRDPGGAASACKRVRVSAAERPEVG